MKIRLFYIFSLLLFIHSCREEIDKSNRYVFTGETVADFMLNRSEKYSHFIDILERAGLLNLLSTYGQYTLFLPDNDAVEKYVQEQDSIYHATKETDEPIWTGITSPLIEELSDSMANVIARTHIVEGNYRTAQFGEGALTKWNMNDRYLGINYKVTDEDYHIMINNTSAIIDSDNEVENGIVHILDQMINSSEEELPEMIAKQSCFSIFTEALKATGFADSLRLIMDKNYFAQNKSSEYSYPKYRYYKYTGFIEPDEVFHANGINNFNDLKAFAQKWYGTEESDNPGSPKNALFKFVSYHFINRELPYDKLIISNYYDDDLYNPHYDLYDYYETGLGKMMKMTKPLSTTEGMHIFINYSKQEMPYNPEMRKHLNVRIMETTEFTKSNEKYADFRQYASNGIIHPIDKILIYSEDEMVGNVLNERMRIDLCSLLPELSSNNIRFNHQLQKLPFSYCNNIKNNSFVNDFSYYRTGFSYLNDEIALKGLYDFSIKLPQFPARTYELRMGTVLIGNMQGDIVQIYLDGKVCGLPIDFRLTSTDPRVGWFSDAGTDDNGVENDKQMRNHGWMKAPDSYLVQGAVIQPARNNDLYVRRIITTQYFDENEHWLRIRKINDSTAPDYVISTSGFDYIELVPLHIINDPTKPEDRH